MLIRLKSAAEIEQFAKAGKIAAAILAAVLAEAKPGTTTKQLDDMARSLCVEYGVKPAFLGYRGFPGTICASVNEEVVHGIPGDRPLESGDILSLDMGVDFDGFIGDTARTIVVGVGGTAYSRLVAACAEALDAAVAEVRPGARLNDIGTAIWCAVKRSGFAVVVDFGGHGIDRGILHSDPFVWNRPSILGRDEDVELRPGMVFAIEPMLVDGDGNWSTADDGWTIVADGPAAHFEHSVAVTDDGCRILTALADRNALAPKVLSPLFTQAVVKV